MRSILILLILVGSHAVGIAQNIPPFKPLRYNEDYSFLEKDSVNNWYTRTKYSRLSPNGSSYISLGGEIRYQYFYFKNEDWGDAPKDNDGFVLSRYLVHADVHLGKSLRSFVQLQSSLANGKLSASPVDENQLDLHQAFIEFKMPVSNQGKLLARIGRQEFSYGSQRLVGTRDGPNNRQSFDAAKLVYSNKHLQADAFFSHYVRSRKNIFDDGFERGTKFWGGYVVASGIPILRSFDIYYLGLSRTVASFDDGSGKEVRHSFGGRVWNRSGHWSYDFEGLYQSGHFDTKKISAWTISSNTAYNFKLFDHKAEVGFKAELISGDKKSDDEKLNTFNPLYPRGAYFGLAALIGPSNLADIHPSLTIELSRKVQLGLDYDAFWRYSKNDGIYAPNVSLIYSGRNVQEKFIGQQYSTDLTITPNQFVYFRAEFTWFKSAEFLKRVGTGKDMLFTGITAQLKF